MGREDGLVRGIFACVPNVKPSLETALHTLLAVVIQALQNPRQFNVIIPTLHSLPPVPVRGSIEDCENCQNELGVLANPCVLVTDTGVVVGWYLPGLIQGKLLVRIIWMANKRKTKQPYRVVSMRRRPMLKLSVRSKWTDEIKHPGAEVRKRTYTLTTANVRRVQLTLVLATMINPA